MRWFAPTKHPSVALMTVMLLSEADNNRQCVRSNQGFYKDNNYRILNAVSDPDMGMNRVFSTWHDC